MSTSRFFERVAPRRAQYQGDSNDIERGLQAGQQVGKLLGSLGDAIKSARRDAIANQLMTDQSISEQPGAGVTQSLGKLGGDGGDDGGSGAPQDLGTLPADQTFTNPSTGNIEPLQQDQGASDDDLRRAMVASQLQGSGSTIGDAIGASKAADSLSGTDFSLRPQDLTPSGPANTQTVGGLLHTGGVQEMDLRKAMLAQQMRKASFANAQAKAQADAVDRQAEASGTGRYAMDAAIKRAQLAKAQAALVPKAPKAEKNPPAVNIGSEPVTDQNQLVQHFEGTYGKGSFSDVMSNLDQVDTKTSPGFVVVGPPDKPVAKIPIGDAQVMVKQQNALRIKQGLPPFRVPGEEADYEGPNMVGASAGNPYIARTNLDVYSRAPGTWVRLPNGKIAQVPGR